MDRVMSSSPDAFSTVLMCADDPTMAARLSVEALRVGLDAIVGSLRQALPFAKQHRPALICLVVTGTRIDVRDVLAALKRDWATRSIEVVVLTDGRDPAFAAECLALGALDVRAAPGGGQFFQRLSALIGSGLDIGPYANWLLAASDVVPSRASRSASL
jgi:DNA-binding response OmpR family regulator